MPIGPFLDLLKLSSNPLITALLTLIITQITYILETLLTYITTQIIRLWIRIKLITSTIPIGLKKRDHLNHRSRW